MPGLIRNDISDFDGTVRGYLKADPVSGGDTQGVKAKGQNCHWYHGKVFNSLNQEKKSVQLKIWGTYFQVWMLFW